MSDWPETLGKHGMPEVGTLNCTSCIAPHTRHSEQIRAMITPVGRMLPGICLHSHKVCGGVLLTVQLLGNDLEICQVNVEQGFEPWPLYFDHYLLSRVEHCPMYLQAQPGKVKGRLQGQMQLQGRLRLLAALLLPTLLPTLRPTPWCCSEQK